MDPYEEVKKLKELLDMGILTEEEFQAKKKELLGLP
ncbi:MAG: SHOCT domain-containing protein [Lachnospiraceae bacterium]|nr:SHOCT domain-containing protein [Lachnospiraceae bacterium]